MKYLYLLKWFLWIFGGLLVFSDIPSIYYYIWTREISDRQEQIIVANTILGLAALMGGTAIRDLED